MIYTIKRNEQVGNTRMLDIATNQAEYDAYLAVKSQYDTDKAAWDAADPDTRGVEPVAPEVVSLNIESFQWGMDVLEQDSFNETLSILKEKYEPNVVSLGKEGEDLQSLV